MSQSYTCPNRDGISLVSGYSQHLASESKFGSSESDLERTLQEVLLCEQSGTINGSPIDL